MIAPPIELPVDDLLRPMVESLKNTHRNLVLVAAPGEGKTTRVAPALVAAGFCEAKNREILLLQPRQVSARAITRRIAEEQGWQVGREVGYQVRFENRTSATTKLKLITEGILIRRLQSDPYLDGVNTVILDEFHERSIHTDLAIALLRELQREVRPDLQIIVMSATIDPVPISKYLGDCPTFESRGRLFPVEVSYLDKQINTLDFHELMALTASTIRKAHAASVLTGADQGNTAARPRALVQASAKFNAGHILVFLPGAGEINYLANALREWSAQNNVAVLPLHARLSNDDQDRALKPSDQRKIILATNIAETSLTIDGVSTVIDSGLARVNRVDWNLGIEKLELGRISLASATQRAGRAGRQRAGHCRRLWSVHDERSFSPSQEPEIMRVPLNEAWLFLADQGYADPMSFSWFQAPPATSLKLAVDQLRALGALNAATGQITSLGRELLKWPLTPRLARLMHDAVGLNLVNEAALIAALLSEQDIIRGKDATGSHGRIESDLLLRFEAIMEFEGRGTRGSNIDDRSARTVLQLRDQIMKLAQSTIDGAKSEKQNSDHELLKLLLGAFSDRVCRRRQAGETRALMVGGKGVKLDSSSCVRQAEFFLAHDVQGTNQAEAVVRQASAIQKSWLKELFPNEIGVTTRSSFDETTGKVFSFTGETFRDLPLDEPRKSVASAQDAGPILAAYLFNHFDQHFAENSPDGRWITRYVFAVSKMPDKGWPDLKKDILKPALEELTYGTQTLNQAFQKPLFEFLQAKLSRELQKVLNQEVPESMTVPSGSTIKINYAQGQLPHAAVRLQEVFGLSETPRLALGTVPVVLHLLSPGFKPVQVTSDLKNFWKNTYFEVRKELKGRYPKHSWPEDPLLAKAEAKGRRRS